MGGGFFMRALDVLINKILNKQKLLMMFDYDGTLTPIVEKPEIAILENQIKLGIEKFAENDFVKTAIITGRTIYSLQEVSGFTSERLYLYGVHGGQILENKEIKDLLSFEEKKQLFDFLTALQKKLLNKKGVLFENKGLSVSMHYRMCDKTTAEEALDIFIKTANEMKITENFKFQEGKKVIELLPKAFNKGTIVKNLINDSKEYFPIYFGDDLNDIPAFKEVKASNGLAFGVGEFNSELNQHVSEWISITDLIEKVLLIRK